MCSASFLTWAGPEPYAGTPQRNRPDKQGDIIVCAGSLQLLHMPTTAKRSTCWLQSCDQVAADAAPVALLQCPAVTRSDTPTSTARVTLIICGIQAIHHQLQRAETCWQRNPSALPILTPGRALTKDTIELSAHSRTSMCNGGCDRGAACGTRTACPIPAQCCTDLIDKAGREPSRVHVSRHIRKATAWPCTFHGTLMTRRRRSVGILARRHIAAARTCQAEA